MRESVVLFLGACELLRSNSFAPDAQGAIDDIARCPLRYGALPYESYADEALSDPYLELKAELERIEVLFK